MILKARYVQASKRRWYCAGCGKRIVGAHLYLYGAADIGEKPSALRLHPDCLHDQSSPKVVQALEHRRIHAEAMQAVADAVEAWNSGTPIHDKTAPSSPLEAYLEHIHEQGS